MAFGTEDLWQGKYRHGSSNQRTGAAVRGCPCDSCQRSRDITTESEERFTASLNGIFQDYWADAEKVLERAVLAEGLDAEAWERIVAELHRWRTGSGWH